MNSPISMFIQIPLGILNKSEQSTSELIECLEFLHSFVPGTRQESDLLTVADRLII